VKRERILQVAVGLLGLFYVARIDPLYTDLAHSKWRLEMKNECEPIQSLAHASVMTIQTVQA